MCSFEGKVILSLRLDSDEIRGWVTEAGEIARRYFGQVEAQWKGIASPVTAADYEIEQLFRQRIAAAYPDHGILGEEYGGAGLDRDYLWALDPIDGTRVFVEGLPTWSITLALLYRRVPVFGIVYVPMVDDWTYTDGDDVINNGQVITGCLKTHWQEDSYVFWRSDAAASYDLQFTRVMSFGASATHLAYTARGASVASLIHDSYVWDFAAGAAFLAKQGGEIRSLAGELMSFDGIDLLKPIKGMYIAGHPDVVRRLRPLVKKRDRRIEHPAW
jgi:fructose-1,6-bisphosphatase/inositol monophosphatase family enzyme